MLFRSITAFLANRVVLEALSGIAWRRKRLASPAPGTGHQPEAPLLSGRAAAPSTLASWSDKPDPAERAE